jgi:hypothetical protein
LIVSNVDEILSRIGVGLKQEEVKPCLSVGMIDRTSSEIPSEPSSPCNERIMIDINGVEVIKDQALVMLKEETVDPENRIKELTQSSGGVIMGAVPDLFLYQVWYDALSLEALDGVISELERMPDVKATGRSIIMQPLAR